MIRGNKYLFSIALAYLLIQTGCATTSHTTDTAGSWQLWPKQTEISADLNEAIEQMAAGNVLQAESGLTLALRAAEPAADYLYAECAALRGDIPLANSRYLDFIAQHPDSALVSPAIARLSMLEDSTMTPMDWDKVLALRVSNPYAAARLVVMQSHAVKNAPDKARLNHPTAVPLVHFHWIGPFSPNVYSVFKRPMGFDDDQILGQEYVVDGQKRTQFQYAADYQTPFNAARSGIYAAETQIEIDRDAQVHIIGYANQLYQLAVDGQLVIERANKDIGKNEILSATLNLSKGSHLVRLRLGYIKSAKSKVAFWIQQNPASVGDNNYAEIKEIRDVSLSSLPSGGVKNVRRVDLSDVVGAKIDPVPSTALQTWLGAVTAIGDGEAQVAEALLQARLEANPDDVVAKYLRALRYRVDADIDPAIRSGNAISLLREIEETAPQIGHAHMLLMLEFISQKQPKMALNVYKSHRADFPDNADTDYMLAEVSRAVDWPDIAADYAVRAAKKSPSSCRLVSQALESEALNYHYTAFDDLNPKSQSCPSVIHAYAKREGDDIADSQRWRRAIEALSNTYPNDARLKLEALNIRVLTDPMGAVDGMHAYLDGVQNGFYPDPDSELMLRFIDRLRSVGHPDDAGRIIDRLLQIFPVEESYQNLSMLQNSQTPFESLRIDGMKTIKDYLAQNRTEAGHSVTVLDYAATHIFPNGAKLGLTHIISRVLSKEGKNVTGEVYLPRNAAILKLHTIKSDTFEKIEPETIDNKSSVTAPNLEVGDFVEVEYLTYDPPVSAFANRAITDMFFYGSDQSPIVHSEYIFEYPADWQVEIIESGPQNTITRHCSDSNGYTRCSAYVDNIPVVLTEPNAPSSFDIIPNIQVYHRYGWDVIQNGMYETIVRQTRQTPYVDRFYNHIQLPQTDSVWEKARVIYEAVIDGIDESQSVNSSDSESATKTITRGTGSRVVTLKALYDKAGFKNYFGLIRSVTAPRNIDKLPSYYDNGYSTVLIVETEKGRAYVQPAEDYVPFDYLTPDTQNMEVIPLYPDMPRFTTRQDDIRDMSRAVDITYQINQDGSAQAKGIETMKGTRELIMRNFLNTVKNDNTRMHQILQNILANNYGRVTLTRLDKENLDNKYQPLVLNYDFDIASFATISENELEISSKMYAYNLVRQYASIAVNERRFPVLIENEALSDRKLTFHAPAGYQWNSATLQDISIHTRYGNFSRQMQITGETLVLHEQIQMLPQYIDLADYAAFREFCLAVDEAQRTVISAKK